MPILHAAISAISRSGSCKSSRSGTSMFCATVSELNSAPSWNSTPQCGLELVPLVGGYVQYVAAQDLDAARHRPVEADDGAQQHRLAGARAADDADHLAAPHIEVDAVMDDLRAERIDQVAHPDDDVVVSDAMRQTFSTEKMIENAASVTMTKKIDFDHRLGRQPADAFGAAR